MTDPKITAFDALEARVKQDAGARPLDRISLRDQIVSVEIGAFQGERDMVQRLRFNIVVEVSDIDENIDDDVDKILSYDSLSNAISHELAAERLNLLETLAARIATRILSEPQAMRVFLRIEKLDRGSGDLGVEIVRSHGDGVPVAPASRNAPHVVFMGDTDVSAEILADWARAFAQSSRPVVICVGALPNGAARVSAADVQRRIDLLLVEQQAWTLAARMPDTAVVASRTELDWSMANGQLCIWAPSKIILDTPDGGTADAADGRALAIWLADHIGAFDVCEIGTVDAVARDGVRVLDHPAPLS